MVGAATQMFERMDSDGDGTVRSDEIEAARLAQFRRLDADGDGYLTDTELSAMRDVMPDRPQRRGRRGGNADPIARMDRSGDGRVSASEFSGMGERLLQMADFDGDGSVTRAEFDQGLVRMQDRRRR